MIFLCFLSLAGVGCGQILISRSLPVLDFQRGKLEKLPIYDPEDERYWQLDVRSYDLSALSLKDRSDDLMMSCFDSKTKWSKDLPPSFNAKYIMELGKNPGLGIRTLHRIGITGKGVYVGLTRDYSPSTSSIQTDCVFMRKSIVWMMKPPCTVQRQPPFWREKPRG